MGLRGPTPTPTNILKARGSRQAARPNEPQPTPGAPRPPDTLDAPAIQVWGQVVSELAAMGTLFRADVNALERYCVLFVLWRKSIAFLQENGETYPLRDKAGNVTCIQQYPQVAIVNKLSVLLLRLEQEFGLTPASRARVRVDLPPQHAADPKAKFFRAVG
jgi:P27 family predicted phage terminase small subunit